MIAVTAAAFLLAGTVKGVIGLGLPTVSIGLLGLWMPPAQAAAILVLPSFLTNVWQTFAGGGVLALARRMWALLAGICIGTFLGPILLPNSGDTTIWLGLAILTYAILGLCNVHFSVPPHAEGRIGLVAGALTGIISGGTGIFVIPNVPYIHALKFDRDKLVQALGLSFTVSTIALAALLAHAGEIRTSLAGPALAALIAAPIGMVLGQFVRRRVKPETFRIFFFFGLLALGGHLALRALF